MEEILVGLTKQQNNRAVSSASHCVFIKWKGFPNNSTNQVITFLFNMETRGSYGDEHNGCSLSLMLTGVACHRISAGGRVSAVTRCVSGT